MCNIGVLARKVKIMSNNSDKLYDVVIVGGGPAGLTAALYLARARYRVLVVEKEKFGGQITITSEVVNYPGVEKTDGTALTETMRKQAQNFGAEFLMAEVQTLDTSGDLKTVKTSRGELQCFGVLLASGAHPRMIGFKGEADFKGHGVAYCATCDGEFFTGKEVFVVGGGFAAAEESVFLTKYAKHVTVLVREPDFTCAKMVAEPTKNHEKITVLTDTEVEEVSGDTFVNYIRYKNSVSGEVTEYKSQNGEAIGVFVFAGYAPATSLVKGIADLDPYGYVITDPYQKTNVDGLYAAGDVCVKNLRQVVTAVGDGAIAATELEKYAASMQQKTGLHPQPPVTRVPKEEASASTDSPSTDGFFTADIKAQLNGIFEKMSAPLTLKVHTNGGDASKELEGFISELCALTDKLAMETVSSSAEGDAPCVRIYNQNNEYTGLAFHGIPGGHEFNSFVIGLYNAAGPGQAIDENQLKQIDAISSEVDMKILVSLSCTMCPDLVMAAQRIAAQNKNVVAEAYDINHFPALKDKYNVMSVPCLVINDDKVTFGKKNIDQLLELMK